MCMGEMDANKMKLDNAIDPFLKYKCSITYI